MGRAWRAPQQLLHSWPTAGLCVGRVAAGVQPLGGIVVASGQDQPQLYSWIWGVRGGLLASVSGVLWKSCHSSAIDQILKQQLKSKFLCQNLKYVSYLKRSDSLLSEEH